MKKLSKIAMFAAAIAVCAPTFAASPTDALSSCLTDHLNGKERKDLATWFFFIMGAHPDIKSYLKASPADIDNMNRNMGQLVTELLTVDCPNELRAAHTADPMAIQKAFQVVGRVAMQELLTNPAVMQSLSAYSKFVDRAKISEILSQP